MKKEVLNLLKKDFLIELKNSSVFNGILLYVVSGIIITYFSFDGRITNSVWNSLFWIIFMFSTITSLTKSFIQESSSRHLYYYTIAKPNSIIISKVIYNFVLLLIIFLLHTLFFIIFIGNPIKDYLLFFISSLLGIIAFSSTLALISAIVSKASNNFTLSAILSFPLLLPFILLLIKTTKASFENAKFIDNINFVFVLLILDIAVTSLVYILFPFIWNE